MARRQHEACLDCLSPSTTRCGADRRRLPPGSPGARVSDRSRLVYCRSTHLCPPQLRFRGLRHTIHAHLWVPCLGPCKLQPSWNILPCSYPLPLFSKLLICNNCRYRTQHCSWSVITDLTNVKPGQVKVSSTCYSTEWTAAFYHLGSGGWLASASDRPTVAHYEAIHCPRQQTIGPAVQHDRYTTTPISRIWPSSRRLLIINQ